MGQLTCLLAFACIAQVRVGCADPATSLQLMRISGCGGVLPALPRLNHLGQLDRAAGLWAAGTPPATAAARSGYEARRAVGLRVSGSDDAMLQELRRLNCRPLADSELTDFGVYRNGRETWLLLATSGGAVAQVMAEPARASTTAARVLQLVNAVRASGTRCGNHSYGPAPALALSSDLSSVASGHAADMARNGYFEHVDLSGRTPADRVRAAGYREMLVGENIAYGPESADEVVAGWLHSPGHCQNIMDPRFEQMGLALAPGEGARRGLYWDQVLTQPARR